MNLQHFRCEKERRNTEPVRVGDRDARRSATLNIRESYRRSKSLRYSTRPRYRPSQSQPTESWAVYFPASGLPTIRSEPSKMLSVTARLLNEEYNPG